MSSISKKRGVAQTAGVSATSTKSKPRRKKGPGKKAGIAAAPTRERFDAAPDPSKVGLRRDELGIVKPSREYTNYDLRWQSQELRAANPGLQARLRGQAADPHIKSVLAHGAVNGNFYCASDMHWGLGKTGPNGDFDPQEDFRRSDVFAKALDHITKQPGNNTLVIAGDWVDILEQLTPDVED